MSKSRKIVIYFLALGAKRIDCRYRLTGDVSILLDINYFDTLKGIEYQYPTLIITNCLYTAVLLIEIRNSSVDFILKC